MSEGRFKSIAKDTGHSLKLVSKEGPLANETNWLRDEGPQILTDQEIRAYSFSQFYLRKLLHQLAPAIFPNCRFSDDKTLVVEKRNGTPYAWEDFGPEIRAFDQVLNELGVSSAHIDKTGSENFLVERGKPPAYIDSVVNTGYFGLLRFVRMMDKQPTYFNELDDRGFIEQISHAVHSSMSETAYSRSEVDFDTLEAHVSQHVTDEQKKRSTDKLISRLQHYYQTFPELNQTTVNEALRKFYQLHKARIDALKPKLDPAVYDALTSSSKSGLLSRLKGLGKR